jgi:ribosome-associated protein
MTITTLATAAKKDTQKLQRAIVDGLEDVKAQDIVVFDTEHLSALFERVIVASGTSNRQTKALAASVRDAVKSAGFPPPRVEGETNGEWIIVDCGAAVVHVMQPTFRQYYHLEELWGDKPVRLKLGAAKPVAAKPVVAKEPAKKPAPAKDAGSLRRSSAAKKGVQAAFPSKAEVKKAAAKAATQAGLKSSARPGAKTAAKKAAVKRVVVGKAPVKAVAAKSAAKKPSAIRRKAP